MKHIIHILLIGVLAAAPLALFAQTTSGEASKVQITAAQKVRILAGDSSAVIEAIEAAGFTAENNQFVAEFAADIFDQVTAEMDALELEAQAEPVSATIMRAFTQVATANTTTPPSVVAQTVRQASKATSKAAVKAAVAKGANAGNVAQSAARGASIGAREGSAGTGAQTASITEAAYSGSADGAGEGADESGLDGDAIVAQSNTGSSEGGSTPTDGGADSRPVITDTDFDTIVVSPEGQLADN